MRVEITDGSGTPRRRRLKDEDGGLLAVAWHHKNKKHHALQLRRRELLLLFAHQEHLLNVSGDVDVHQVVDAVLGRLWFLGSADNGQLGVDRAIPTPLRKKYIDCTSYSES